MSHVPVHDVDWHVIVTTGLMLLALASWALRPGTRILGAVSP